MGDQPVPWGPDVAWGSHIPPLIACLANRHRAIERIERVPTGDSKGYRTYKPHIEVEVQMHPILEVGCGHWSTPVLRGFAAGAGVELVSIESAPEWAEKFPGVLVTPHYEGIEKYAARKWSVVFIDHSPGERRVKDAVLFADTADFVVIHDWSAGEIHGQFEQYRDRWKYRAIYDRYMPSTIILSNRFEIPYK